MDYYTPYVASCRHLSHHGYYRYHRIPHRDVCKHVYFRSLFQRDGSQKQPYTTEHRILIKKELSIEIVEYLRFRTANFNLNLNGWSSFLTCTSSNAITMIHIFQSTRSILGIVPWFGIGKPELDFNLIFSKERLIVEDRTNSI